MKAALLLVDLQNDFLAAPDLQPSPGRLVEAAAGLLAAWRARGLPVLHVYTTVHREPDERMAHWKSRGVWQCVAGTPGHAAPPGLRPVADEFVGHKTAFNAFEDARLADELARRGVHAVVLAGLHLHACVRQAALECLQRGFKVLVAEDCCGSHDPVHSAASRRWLADRAVRFEPAGRVLSWLAAGVWPTTALYSPRCVTEVLFELRCAGPGEIQGATQAARAGLAHWASWQLDRRLQPLLRLADWVDAAADDLARQMAIELGKPLRHGREECHRAAASVRDIVRLAAAAGDGSSGAVRRRPLGVVGVVTAWNNPVAIPLGKLTAALAWGNTAVWKPAPPATRLSERLRRAMDQAGLPSGAVNLVTGDHATALDLALDPATDAVTLTGSERAGHALQEICARRHLPFQAELNGNNAALVWDDADLSEAAAQVAWGGFGFAGQRCTANRRVVVSAAVFTEFVDRLAHATAALPWGDPLDDRVEIGPLVSTLRRDEVAAAVRRARADGVTARCQKPHLDGGREPDWVSLGAYLAPTILCCTEPRHEIVQEETMGPVVVVQSAADFGEALELCNGVRQGLAAALFSHSASLRRRFLEEAQAGILKVNASTAGADPTLPFGGWKSSGVGPPEHGEADRLFFTRLQTVYESPP
jgi:acyl-CoA reductase-like NAD-dependent aldehyde dehydrogenase/nicotinamidase-related amidase